MIVASLGLLSLLALVLLTGLIGVREGLAM
jgi:hypothetical protein